MFSQDSPSPPPRRTRRGPSERLRDALAGLAGCQMTICRHEETNWASITFAGARHRLEAVFEGIPAVEAGERFIAALPDHEFSIPGQLVADAAVIAVDHRLAPEPRMTVTCEVLLLADA